MTKRSLLYGLFLVSSAITLFASEIYRPYIWANRINDFGLADSCTNISGVLVASFLSMGIKNSLEKKEDIQGVMGMTMAFIVYEFIQIALPWGTFDWKDIIASVIGGALTIILYETSTFFIKERQHEF